LINRDRETRELQLKRLLNLAGIRVGESIFGGKRTMRPERGSIAIAERSHVGEELLAQHRRELATQAAPADQGNRRDRRSARLASMTAITRMLRGAGRDG